MTTANYLPAVLPPPDLVEAASPAAAKAIRRAETFAATLPARPTDEQANELAALRQRAFAALSDDAVVPNLADEEAALLAELRASLGEFRTRWARLEGVRGLADWRAQPWRCAQHRIRVMDVPSGGGGNRPLYAGELLAALAKKLAEGAN